jgi:hypothetical protein
MTPITRSLLEGARPIGALAVLCLFVIFLACLVSLELFAGQMRGRCYHEDGSPAHYGEPADASVLSGLQIPNGRPILCNSGQTGGFGRSFMLQQACPETQTCSMYTNPACTPQTSYDMLSAGSTTSSPTTASAPQDLFVDPDSASSTALVGVICEYNDTPDPTFNIDTLGNAMLTLVRTWMLDDWWPTMRYLQVTFVNMCVCVYLFILYMYVYMYIYAHAQGTCRLHTLLTHAYMYTRDNCRLHTSLAHTYIHEILANA